MGYFSGGYSLSETGPETDLLLDEIAKVFFCQYGVTEYADALTKYNAGKGLYAIYNKKTYLLTDYTNSTFYFAQLNRSLGYASLSLSASGWAVVDSVSVAPTDSPVFTGTPTAPTADANTNNEQIATTAYADRASYNSLMEDTASGSIASFPDGAENVPVKELSCEITPIQDLHGQASPYPEGGSKNLVPLTVDGIKSLNQSSGAWSGNAFSVAGVVFTIQTDNANNVIGILVNGTATSNIFFTLGSILNADIPASAVVNGCPSGGAAFSTYQISINDSATGTTPAYDTGNGATFAKSTFSGNAVVIIRIGNGTTVNSLVFKPMVRDASITDATFAPYSNICPISGYTGAEIPVTGINVWDEAYTAGGVVNGINGSLVGTGTTLGYTDYVRIKGGVSYYFNGSGLGSSVNGLAWYDESKTYISGKNFATLSAVGEVTAPSNAAFVRFSVHVDEVGAISFNYPSTDTSYEPYLGTTYSVSWSDEAGTVYGGFFKVNEDGSVDLTVDHASDTLGTTGWTYSGTPPVFRRTVSTMKSSNNAVCEAYKTVPYTDSYTTMPDMSIKFGGTGNQVIYVNDSRYTTPEAFVAVADTQIVYELATPQTYHLDSIGQITTLLGDNNIWENTGDISVRYRCNTALYIEKKLG